MRKVDKKILLSVTAVSAIAILSSGSDQNAARASAQEQMAVREHINKGNYYLGKRQFDKAIESYEEALGVDSDSQAAKDNIVLVYNNWGIMLFQQGKYPEAKQKWERALKLNPTYMSAKKNIQTMKAHLQKIGLDPEEATRLDGDENQKPAKQSAVILTPGIKQSTGGGASGDPAANTPMFPPNTSSPSAAVKTPSTTTTETSTSSPFSSSTSGGHKKQTYGSGTIMFRPSSSTSSTPPASDSSSQTTATTTAPTATVSPSSSSVSSFSTGTAPPVTSAPPVISTPPVTSTPPVVSTPPPVSTSPVSSSTHSESSGQTIDEKLSAIELKVYGRKLGDLPVMKRLEKLENDTIGQVGSGTVYQRVENLKRHYGM